MRLTALTEDMFASASTFKVELDETAKIIREAGPKSFVILDGESASVQGRDVKPDEQNWDEVLRLTTAWP